MPYVPKKSEILPIEPDSEITLLGFMGEIIGTSCICSVGGLVGFCKDDFHLNFADLAVCNGFMVTVIVYCFINYSGAHFNPAISVSYLISGHVNWIKCLVWIGAQAIGSILGG